MEERINLLTPIRDLAENWNIDIAAELEDYLAELSQVRICINNNDKRLNFAEAALLIQGTSQVYSKKVEFLYQLVNTVLSHILQQRKKRAVKQKQALADATESTRPIHDSFRLLDDDLVCESEESLNIDEVPIEDEVLWEDESSAFRSSSLTVPYNVRYRNVLHDEKINYKLVCCVVDEHGYMLLEKNDSTLIGRILPLDNSHQQRKYSRPTPSRRSSKPPTPRGIGNQKKGFDDGGELISNEKKDVEMRDKNQGDDGGDEITFEKKKRSGDDGSDDDSDGFSTSDEDIRYRRSEREVWRVWKPLDPHNESKNPRKKEYQKRTKFHVPRLPREKDDYPIFGISIHRKNVLNVLPYKNKHAMSRLVHPEFGYFLRCEKLRMRVEYARKSRENKEVGVIDASVMDDDDAEFEVTLDDESLLAEKIQSTGQTDVSGFVREHDFDDGGEMIENETFVDAESFLENEEESRIFDEKYGSLGSSLRFSLSTMREGDGLQNATQTYEDLCKLHILRYMKNTDEFRQENELNERVDEWKKKILPLLLRERTRLPFYIHDYYDKVIGKFESVGETKEIEKLIVAEDAQEVCRHFLSVLALCNRGVVNITTDEDDKTTVTLVTKENVHITGFLDVEMGKESDGDDDDDDMEESDDEDEDEVVFEDDDEYRDDKMDVEDD